MVFLIGATCKTAFQVLLAKPIAGLTLGQTIQIIRATDKTNP